MFALDLLSMHMYNTWLPDSLASGHSESQTTHIASIYASAPAPAAATTAAALAQAQKCFYDLNGREGYMSFHCQLCTCVINVCISCKINFNYHRSSTLKAHNSIKPYYKRFFFIL